MLRRLFCYGTLQSPAVMTAIVGRSPRRRAAVLPGHQVARLAGRPWLGITISPAGTVSGTLYHDLTPAELRRLDRYEGTDYRRATVRVRMAAGRYSTWVYLPRRPLLADGVAAASAPVRPADWRGFGLAPPRRSQPASKSRPR